MRAFRCPAFVSCLLAALACQAVAQRSVVVQAVDRVLVRADARALCGVDWKDAMAPVVGKVCAVKSVRAKGMVAVYSADKSASWDFPRTALQKVGPRWGETKVNPKDGAEMVYVPAGEFLMGSSEADIDAAYVLNKSVVKDAKREQYQDETPQRRVYLDGCWIYRNLVTVAQYRRFCEATSRKMPDNPDWVLEDDHPIVSVSWDDAKAYCDWADVSLPTEAQWEKAARGTDGRVYPWGNEFDPANCICEADGVRHSTAPAGSCPSGASSYGCLDMAGNVWEWCADWYRADYYKTASARNPDGPTSGSRRVMRGGAWYYIQPNYFRSASRHMIEYDEWLMGRGFRGASAR
jgi:formylglycine-generating enzyme required for sulfatase activity